MFVSCDKKVCKIGDKTSSGGSIIEASGRAFISDDKAVALLGDKATCPLHKGVFAIIEGDTSYLINGKAVATSGCKLECGCFLL